MAEKKIQRALLAHLKRRHTGKDKATPSRALEVRFCVHGATIRRAVLALRCAGEPICSGPGGYYYTTDSPELWDTIGRIESHAATSFQVSRGLRRAAGNLPGSGQTRLPEAEGGDAYP